MQSSPLAFSLVVWFGEELRFRRLMAAVAHLERRRPKGLYLWSRPQGLRQIDGPGLGAAAERTIPDTADPLSELDHLASAERGLYVLCDYGAYLAPFGQPA